MQFRIYDPNGNNETGDDITLLKMGGRVASGQVQVYSVDANGHRIDSGSVLRFTRNGKLKRFTGLKSPGVQKDAAGRIALEELTAE